MEGTPAVPQADPLERRQLVEAGRDERDAGRVALALSPGEKVGRRRATRVVQPVGDEPVEGPGDQVAGEEDPRRRRGAASVPRTLPADAAEDDHHRRRRRQHHRGGHRHPDPEVPAEPAELGTRPGVHPPHPHERDDPGDEGAADERARDGDGFPQRHARQSFRSGWMSVKP